MSITQGNNRRKNKKLHTTITERKKHENVCADNNTAARIGNKYTVAKVAEDNKIL